ncbi:PREDICTED: putative nuclease HARBI1 [Rhagoletis zephyria]|nr:PREDICTED: putative nuclease HARBI1 [Rhagoletis zephyria]
MVSRILHQVTKILQNYLAQRYIILPTTLEQQNIVKQRFFNATRFPGVLGAIDCTHVKIKKPSSDVEYCYINRKGYFSKNVQLVCDFDLNILGCFARYGGSTHDAYIWESSIIKSHMLNAYTANGSTGWLLGDSGYPLQPWLMTPFRNVEHASQQRYNDSHARARNCVERLNGVLKKVFACLSQDRGLMEDPSFAGSIITACCTLHNIRKRFNLPLPEVDPPADLSDNQSSGDNVELVHVLNEGRAVRNIITRNHFYN